MGVVYLSLAFICILVLSINFIINIRNFYVHSFVERRRGEAEKKKEREKENIIHPFSCLLLSRYYHVLLCCRVQRLFI